jgi:hypothetical protein
MPNWDTPGLYFDMPGLCYDDPAAWPTPLNPMAKDQTKPVSAATLADDKSAIDACKKITTYAPAKADYNQAALDAAQATLETTETVYNQADAALKSARDNMVAAQWTRHNLVLGMRTQVKAQFGDDSNEVQSVGLKKKSEYKNKSSAKTPAKPTP